MCFALFLLRERESASQRRQSINNTHNGNLKCLGLPLGWRNMEKRERGFKELQSTQFCWELLILNVGSIHSSRGNKRESTSNPAQGPGTLNARAACDNTKANLVKAGGVPPANSVLYRQRSGHFRCRFSRGKAACQDRPLPRTWGLHRPNP